MIKKIYLRKLFKKSTSKTIEGCKEHMEQLEQLSSHGFTFTIRYPSSNQET